MPDTTVRALVRRAHRVFPAQEYIPHHTLRHNRKAWVRSVMSLGQNWVLAPGSTFTGLWTPGR